MSESDDFGSSLPPAEAKVVKDYGGWENFMAIYGLKPWEKDDIDEALAIVEAFAKNDIAMAKQGAKK